MRGIRGKGTFCGDGAVKSPHEPVKRINRRGYFGKDILAFNRGKVVFVLFCDVPAELGNHRD